MSEQSNFEDFFDGQWDRKNNPFVYFVNHKIFKGKTIFGYNPHYVIFDFINFLKNRVSDFLYEIKWAWQRIFRGWDDRAYFSMDMWITKNAIEILKVLRNKKMGIPNVMFEGLPYENEDKYSYSEESYKIASERWDSEIERMISGFEASKKIQDHDWDDLKDYEILENVFKEGMASFTKYYFSLWD